MKYCSNCGHLMKDQAIFCQVCGAQSADYSWEQKQNINQGSWNQYYQTSVAEPLPKKKGCLNILLWIFFLPIMAIIAIAKSKKLNAPIKAVSIAAIALLTIIIGVSNRESQQNKTTSESSSSQTVTSQGLITQAISSSSSQSENEKDEVENNPIFEAITDKTLTEEFSSVCEQIGMDLSKIKDVTKVDDWAGGPRYSFSYENLGLVLYCDMDLSIQTVKLGADIDIYKKGFEPYQISDYIWDTSITTSLQLTSEDLVKAQLNYPATAKFPWLDWSYGRERSIYSVSSSVTAKNAFGVEDKLLFVIKYEVEADSATVVYFVLDGVKLIDKMSSIVVPERKEVAVIESQGDETVVSLGEIILTDGQLGNYGKKIILDGEEYINYHVPEGTYEVKNMVKSCKVFLAKDEYYKNSDGYLENEVVEILEFSTNGETKTLVVHSGEHIELTISASVILTPIK